jgi:hypothetical protein
VVLVQLEMTARDLTLVVIGKDWAALREFNLEAVNAAECILVSNEAGLSISTLGNHYLEHARRPVLGILHADSSLGPGACDAFALAASAGAVVGIVGRDIARRYVWCTQGGGPVETLDCCSVFLRRDLGLAFDEINFDGFHCYVEDLCMQAHARGIPVSVPVAAASHRGNPNAPDRERFMADYARYKRRLIDKWGHVVTT